MSTVSITIKTDAKVKAEARKVAEELGVSLSVVLEGFLRQFVKTKRVASSMEEIPNARTRALLKEAEEDRKAGRASPIFDSAEDAIAWLHKQGV